VNIPFIKLIATGLLTFCLTTAQAAAPAPGEYGYLFLHDSGQPRTCEIDLGRQATYERASWLSDIPTCAFGWVGSFSFKNAKSAVTVEIRSWFQTVEGARSDCNRYENPDRRLFAYRFTIKTTGTVADTKEFTYDDMFRTDIAENPVIVPGVRLIEKERGSNNYNKPLDQLFACIHVIPSD
jgi:opacity protein-like surface antigen